jgi:gluconate 2-dehydrogenase gamma chain
MQRPHMNAVGRVMAGQGIERRELLRILATASVAAGFAGFNKWAFACEPVHAAAKGVEQIKSATYTPQFFFADEYPIVVRLSEMIIPSDDGPGSREAGVAEFIDFMVFHDESLQYPFRLGLSWMNAHSERLHGKKFLELTPADQTDLLRHLAYKKEFRDGEEDGRDFFNLMREYTTMGFYTTRVGLESINCPNLQFYNASPACPHVDDREHKHLPPPKY